MPSGLNAPRSRAGCQECRRRRKKCDQLKPSCSLCQRAGRDCSYDTKLSWGGRPFGKSIFGRYSGQLTALKGEDGSRDFVYTPVVDQDDSPSPDATSPKSSRSQSVSTPRKKSFGRQWSADLMSCSIDVTVDDVESSKQLTQRDTDTQRLGVPWELSPSPDLSYLEWMSTPWRSLLDHFITVTSMSLSCHSSVRSDYCSTLVPIALERPCLLTAILNIAGHNRKALGMEQSESDLERLKAISVANLRQMLTYPSPDSEDMTLATTLALCVGDITAGGERPGSWRTHLRGAAAMLESNDGYMGPGLQRDRMSPLQIFLRRWYLSIEATTLLGSNEQGTPPGYPTALRLSYELGPSFIDEFCGFPPYLIRVFGEFTSLATEASNARLSLAESPLDVLTLSKIEQATSGRIQRAYALLAEIDQKLRSGAIHPSTESTLTLTHREDYLALNATFHHSAAIHIHCRVLNTPSASPLVQSRVKAIIQLVSTVTFTRDACPAVAFLLPLFTAGSEAMTRQDQNSVENFLHQMETTYGMGNVKSALRLLSEIWKRRELGVGGEVQWEKLSAELGLDLLCW